MRRDVWPAQSGIRYRGGIDPVDVDIGVRALQDGKGSFASSVTLKMFGSECVARFSEGGAIEGLTVNDWQWKIPEPVFGVVDEGRLLPRPNYFREYIRRGPDGVERKGYRQVDPAFDDLVKVLMLRLAHGKTNRTTIEALAARVPVASDEAILAYLKDAPGAPATFKRNAARLTVNSTVLAEIRNYLFAAALPDIIRRVDDSLAEFLKGVSYIKPLRATAQRYYRSQDLAVDELDPDGANIAMFLESLRKSERDSLNAWLDTYFGVRLSSISAGGHTELKLSAGPESRFSNLADLGVGYSQMLPILLQLWDSTGARRKRGNRATSACVVIEQPELHLHPAYQARLADAFVATISDARAIGISLTLISETHSPYLINRLGELIEQGTLASKDVAVVLFEPSEAPDNVAVRSVTFGEDGILKNWPFGFFEP